ncbi:MAG: hypothetical protein ABIQ52_17940 [Vicinamibacterales bacterium]
MLVIVAPVTSSRLVTLLAAAWTALAAWVSFGAITFTGPSSGMLGAGHGARLGLLPLDAGHLAVAIVAGLVVAAIGLIRGRGAFVARAVSPLALLFLPWLPFPVPAVFLVWTGAVGTVVWLGVALALTGAAMRPWHLALFPWPRWPAVIPGVLAFVVFAIAAWSASPSRPGGDEPHYLVITQSLLSDGDLRIENNHRRGDYRAYFAGDLAPHVIRPGRNGEMYSIHAPGLPALILPAFAIAGYPGVVVFMIVIAAAACALAWSLAWRATGSMSAAWFGWSVVTFSAPFLLESFTVFPDGPGAAIVLTGFWALLREEGQGDGPVSSSPVPWVLHGAALAMLPWLHTRFAVLAATLGGLILVRLARSSNPVGKAAAFLALPALSALAWLGFFLVTYGTLDPTAPYGGAVGSSLAFLPNGFGGLLFDQGFGLIATAPVLAVAVIGFARARRLGFEWLVMAAPYVLSVGTYAMWWAGSSGPARFLVPLVLPLAIPAACTWAAVTSRGAKAVMLIAVLVSAWLAVVMAGGANGRLGYHSRNESGPTAAPYLEWSNPVVDLPGGSPAFVPLPAGSALQARQAAARAGFIATLPWLFCIGGAAWGVIVFARARSPEAIIALAMLAFGCGAMAALAVVWRLNAVEPLTIVPAQIQALQTLAADRVAVLDLTSRRRLTATDVGEIVIELPVRRAARGTPRGLNRPLATLPALPAGSYLVTVKRHGAGDALLIIGVGNDQFSIVTRPLAAFDAGLRLELPAGARVLTIRGDEAARDQLEAVRLRPLALAAAARSRVARHAVRYEGGVAFFLDESSFPEPSGFWVGGARSTSLTLLADPAGAAAALVLRNAPVENSVTLEFGSRREEIILAAGEERQFDVPAEAASGNTVLTIRSAAGFRPSDADPNSRDTRRLGVFVRVVGRRQP